MSLTPTRQKTITMDGTRMDVRDRNRQPIPSSRHLPIHTQIGDVPSRPAYSLIQQPPIIRLNTATVFTSPTGVPDGSEVLMPPTRETDMQNLQHPDLDPSWEQASASMATSII